MKMRIIQKPSILGQPNVYWYHAQVKRFGFWIDCRNDLIISLKYSSQMLVHSWDTNLERVQQFVNYTLRGEEMFPEKTNVVIQEYET